MCCTRAPHCWFGFVETSTNQIIHHWAFWNFSFFLHIFVFEHFAWEYSTEFCLIYRLFFLFLQAFFSFFGFFFFAHWVFVWWSRSICFSASDNDKANLFKPWNRCRSKINVYLKIIWYKNSETRDNGLHRHHHQLWAMRGAGVNHHPIGDMARLAGVLYQSIVLISIGSTFLFIGTDNRIPLKCVCNSILHP